ncbi:MAG: hypothetical protein NC337_05445 [Roseburia sp.]|nr:hypothetical protein [Roseburia sp.]
MADNTEWIVDGFRFGTEKDARLAMGERKKIERLEAKLDYQNPRMLYAVYKKAVENRIFVTPVGYDFLKKLQRCLKENPASEEAIPEIPVSGVYSFRESTNPAVEKVKASRRKVREKPKDREFFSRRTSICVNIGLLALIVVMFFITATGNNPNILNYEQVIQNRYAQWEQNLSQRESVIREKEKALLEGQDE